MNRRTFLETMTGATAATLLATKFSWAEQVHKIEKVGIQCYTVRDLLNQDFDGTMAKLASYGYKEVELGFYTDKPPKEIRAILDHHGLVSPSAGHYYKDIVEKWPSMLERCHTIGHRYLVIPSVDDEFFQHPDPWKRAAESFTKSAAIAKKDGIQLTYHCHWREFVPDASGKRPYDILLEESDPQLLLMEMDLGWTTIGHGDPLHYFAKYPGRFPLVHVKDFKKIPPESVVYSGHFDGDDVIPDMTEVGHGVIDWKRIFAHSEQAGIKHYFMEHDQPADPLECARLSCEYMEKLRF
jgi:sugar phosphate isomerase/epimerase